MPVPSQWILSTIQPLFRLVYCITAAPDSQGIAVDNIYEISIHFLALLPITPSIIRIISYPSVSVAPHRHELRPSAVLLAISREVCYNAREESSIKMTDNEVNGMRRSGKKLLVLLCTAGLLAALAVTTWAVETEGQLYRIWQDPVSGETYTEEISGELSETALTAPALHKATRSVSAAADPYFSDIDSSLPRYGRGKLAKMDKADVLLDLYDKMVRAAMVSSTEDLSFLNNEVLHYDKIRLVYNAFSGDYPEIFWTRGVSGMYSSSSESCICASLSYNDYANDLAAKKAAFKTAADAIMQDLPSGSDYQKELYLHDALVNRITYSYEMAQEQNAYTAIVEGKAVCAGYAHAFQYLLMRAGIESYYVTGTGNGENHAWNLVKIDGQWYFADITFDDPIGGQPSLYYAYFNITTDMLEEDHTIGGSPDNVPIERCTATDAFYHTVNNSIVSSTGGDEQVKRVADVIRRYGYARLYVADADYNMNAVFQWYYDHIGQIREEIGGSAPIGSIQMTSCGRECIISYPGSIPQTVLGDVNDDNEVTAQDVQMLYSYLTGISTLTGVQQTAADVNKDGRLDVYDLQRLYEHVSGIRQLSAA